MISEAATSQSVEDDDLSDNTLYKRWDTNALHSNNGN